MMRSLWAGVTGLQAHQIAMDVEGNNIANVNTVGYKYNRANFDDLIYQQSRIATSPQNQHGGVNNMEVGLGTQINSTTRIFKQGSLQTTDKQTDIALQGDGFFMVSPDGGKTTYYTRNGDFSRDSEGNFVDNGGNIVQGWMRDEVTGEIDPTRPLSDIKIPTGLTVPARATTNIALKGNLDSGNDVGNKKIPIYQLDQYHNWVDTNKDGIKTDTERHEENNIGENRFYVNRQGEQRMTERGADLGVLFNNAGDAYNLRTGQGIWVSYADAKTRAMNVGARNDGTFAAPKNLNIKLNGETIVARVNSVSELATAINQRYSKTGVEASVINGNQLVLTNRNNLGTTAASRNIKMTVNSGDTIGGDFLTTNIITAYQYTYNKTRVSAQHTYDDSMAREVTTTEDLREAMQKDARLWTNYKGTRIDNDGTECTMVIQVAEPNQISTTEPKNVITGYVRFNPDGSLATYSPASITFGAQNGSSIGQHIELKFGTTQTTDGLTSTDNNSSTSDISQDGYASGELHGLRIDGAGTLIGSFTNGRSLGLAQVGVAKFANNQGLAGEGGNLFSRSANSCDPIIGAAQTAGRGKISASSLEMSNVDLSRSLTQLIVVQRGFQANSKTITTSDEMLNTLLQLK